MPFDGILPPPSHRLELTRILHHYINDNDYSIIYKACQDNSIYSLPYKICQFFKKSGIALYSFQNARTFIGNNVCLNFTFFNTVQLYARIFPFGFILAYAFTEYVKIAF